MPLFAQHAAGCHGAVIPERRAVQMTPAAARAAAERILPIARVVNIARCLEECKQAGNGFMVPTWTVNPLQVDYRGRWP